MGSVCVIVGRWSVSVVYSLPRLCMLQVGPYQCFSFAVYCDEVICDVSVVFPVSSMLAWCLFLMESRRPFGCLMTTCRCPCPTLVLSLVLLGSVVVQQSILVLTCSAGLHLGHCICPRLTLVILLSMSLSHSFLRQSSRHSGLRLCVEFFFGNIFASSQCTVVVLSGRVICHNKYCLELQLVSFLIFVPPLIWSSPHLWETVRGRFLRQI